MLLQGLETHVAAFKDEAEVLKQWDARLKDNFDNIKRVETDIESVQVAQLELSKKLEGIHVRLPAFPWLMHKLLTPCAAQFGQQLELLLFFWFFCLINSDDPGDAFSGGA